MMRLRCGELSRINRDQIVHLFLDLIPSSFERLAIRIVAGQKETAMCAFERIEIVFDQARKANDFDCVITQISLLDSCGLQQKEKSRRGGRLQLRQPRFRTAV